jgi:hypothetical protein
MAKIETPAEAAPSPVLPPRPARRGQLLGQGVLSGGMPPVAPKPRSERDAGFKQSSFNQSSFNQSMSGPDVVRTRAASEARFAQAAGEGLAQTPEQRRFELISDAEVADEGEEDDDAPETDRQSNVPLADAEPFGLPRPRGVAKLPMANLQMPSYPRLDLTPSPVPRVALSPATGSVDISLVPGPHGSRHLPTLAAHHAFGRRQQRRAAPARTLPPPGRASGEPRLGGALAKDVRSSKREIVLGLTIGLGLSLVLAAVGQNYLRSEPIANAPGAELESLTLSARPGSTSGEGSMQGSAEPPAAERAPSAAAASATASDGAGEAARGAQEEPARESQVPSRARLAESTRAPVPTRAVRRTSVSGALASTQGTLTASRRHAPGGGFGAEPGSHPVTFHAGTSDGRWSEARSPETRSLQAKSPEAKSSEAKSPDAKSFEAGKSPEEAPPSRARMSPAESAGLGLDLPL